MTPPPKVPKAVACQANAATDDARASVDFRGYRGDLVVSGAAILVSGDADDIEQRIDTALSDGYGPDDSHGKMVARVMRALGMGEDK